ncbi:MAG: glycoside hydrolase family 3 N-terminal domain-containing protein, partial [Steroidobacteraceae bacterium]
MSRHRDIERNRVGRRFGRNCLWILAVAAATTATAIGAGRQAPVAEPAVSTHGIPHPLLWPTAPPAPRISRADEALVGDLLAHMTLEEKVAQMIQADISDVTPEDLRRYRLGAVLAGGGSAPQGNVRAAPRAWLDLADSLYRASIADPSPGHRPIPILFGIDAVHGDAKIRGATIYPHNIALGAAHDPQLIERIGRATAEEVATTGLDWTFAPTVAVARDVRWGRTYESYSENPALVATYAARMVEGLQGMAGTRSFFGTGHTLATAKHFLGDGGTVDGRDQGNNVAPEDVLIRVHDAGYPAALGAGALVVMASYNSWQGVKMHANRGLLTDVLKGRMGFEGFVIGDWNAQEEVPGCTKYDCPAVINAGIDMVMAPDSWKRFYRNTLREVQAGAIPMTRIDDAVRRILRVKALAGLFTEPPPVRRPDAGRFDLLGSPAHRALARQAVRESLVLLKNDHGLLPLSPHAHVLVMGAAADSIGDQSGGWTVDWQGDHNTNADFPGGTSIFAGIAAAVTAAGGTAALSPDG